MTKRAFPKSDNVDILLLLEGTYPFVSGGVSSWAYTLMLSMPQFRFGVVFLGGSESLYDEPKYPFPDNLVYLDDFYLFPEFERPHRPAFLKEKYYFYDEITQLHSDCLDPFKIDSEKTIGDIERLIFSENGISEQDFWYSRQSWDYTVEKYKEKCSDISFIDYFWTVRGLHAPLWRLFDISKKVPVPKLYHSASTGYAGMLGSILSRKHDKPFILTEHGIYTKERRIDLLQRNWLEDYYIREAHTEYINDRWITLFEILARISYSAADPIISLFGAYRDRQIDDGAPKNKTIIVPNGVDVDKFAACEHHSHDLTKPVIAMVGRVVKIKDIKTFIRCMAVVIQKMPDAIGWIVGPEETEPDYVEECHELIRILKLEKNIHLMGTQKMENILKKIDLLVLSSISEGQPLVVLEAFAAGIPTVLTDVGACRELVYGANDEDAKLGQAGEVLPISSPGKLADAILSLLTDPNFYQSAAKAAKARANTYYALNDITNIYKDLYLEKIEEAN